MSTKTELAIWPWINTDVPALRRARRGQIAVALSHPHRAIFWMLVRVLTLGPPEPSHKLRVVYVDHVSRLSGGSWRCSG